MCESAIEAIPDCDVLEGNGVENSSHQLRDQPSGFMSFYFCHVTHKQHPDVACSGHIICGPHGDIITLPCLGHRRGQILFLR